jgi:hypothetical protein
MGRMHSYRLSLKKKAAAKKAEGGAPGGAPPKAEGGAPEGAPPKAEGGTPGGAPPKAEGGAPGGAPPKAEGGTPGVGVAHVIPLDRLRSLADFLWSFAVEALMDPSGRHLVWHFGPTVMN